MAIHKNKQVGLRMPEGMFERLNKIADEKERSVQEVIREAIELLERKWGAAKLSAEQLANLQEIGNDFIKSYEAEGRHFPLNEDETKEQAAWDIGKKMFKYMEPRLNHFVRFGRWPED